MPRPRAPLTFGAGLDRATGAGARDPRSLYDGQNVVAREAGLALRSGLAGSGLPALDWGTDVLATFSVERSLDVLQVVFDRTSRDIRIYRVNPVTPPTRQNVGTWGTLNALAPFPVITHAEAGGVVYFAHAEEALAYRLPTKYWEPGTTDTDPGTLTTATADFDGSGSPGDIFFYGVCTYREYIAGWGWGTEEDNTTKDRPEIVRLSRPDDPTKFPAESYFLCGTRSTRVIGCTPMPNGLLVGTRTQRYTIFGTDPETFGVDLTDPSHGIVSPRAWQTINGVAYTWSQTGPRVTTDPMAPSEDLSIPLDLMQAQPASWPARGPAREAFAAYEPEQRILYWVWPNLTDASTRTMVYACSLRQPASPRFTATIFERRVASAGRYLTGKAPPPVGVGYASALSFVDGGWVPANNGRTLTLSWTNTSTLGSETIEVWLKVGSGAWALHQTVATTVSTQSLTFTGRESLEVYQVALRHKSIDGTYTVGYTGATPDDWTAGTAAGSKATVTTGAATPTLTVTLSPTTFQRISASAAFVQITGNAADARCPLVLERNLGAGWEVVETGIGAGFNTPFLLQPSANAFLAATAEFRVRHQRGALTGAYSNTVSVFGGLPDVAPTVQHVFDASDAAANTRAVELFVRMPRTGYGLEVEVIATGARTLFPSRISTEGYVVPSTLTGAGTLQYRVRYARQTAGVYDYSAWSGTLALACNPSGDVPPAPVIGTATLLYPGTFEDEQTSPEPFSGNLSYLPPFPAGVFLGLVAEVDETPYRRRGTNVSGYGQLLLFNHPVADDYTAALLSGESQAVLPQPAGVSVPYNSLRTFLFDTTTLRRGPWATVAVPT